MHDLPAARRSHKPLHLSRLVPSRRARPTQTDKCVVWHAASHPTLTLIMSWRSTCQTCQPQLRRVLPSQSAKLNTPNKKQETRNKGRDQHAATARPITGARAPFGLHFRSPPCSRKFLRFPSRASRQKEGAEIEFHGEPASTSVAASLTCEPISIADRALVAQVEGSVKIGCPPLTRPPLSAQQFSTGAEPGCKTRYKYSSDKCLDAVSGALEIKRMRWSDWRPKRLYQTSQPRSWGR